MDGGGGGAPGDAGSFRLAAELYGHEGSVRALASLRGGEILVSGGEDGTVKRWLRVESGAPSGPGQPAVAYEPLETIAEAEHWVVSLTAMPPGVVSEAPAGGFVAGSQDKIIRVYDVEGNRVRMLLGHQHGVISLAWTASGQLLSGSWDGTAKVWDVEKGECVATLEGHENGVAVLGLPNGVIATGSTGREQAGQIVDVQIRLWKDGRTVKTIKDHQGPIRSLSLLPSLGFMSTSNDGTVRVWSLDGDALAVVGVPPGRDGQAPFVYKSVALAGEGGVDVAAVGEEPAAFVWRGQELIQRVDHPRGLWAVAALENGEMATGCHDGVVRLFTRDPAKTAPPEVIAGFESAVDEARKAAARGGPSQEELANLPDWSEASRHRGKREGMVQMFRKNGTAIIAAQWSQASGTWIEVGEVTGTSNAGTIDGVAYDHVFPIEIEQPGGEGVKTHKIGYNIGDNPFLAAQAFIDANMLPQRYLAQIADYITQRAGQAAPVIGQQQAAAASAGRGGGGGGYATSGLPSAPGFAQPPAPPTGRYFPKVGYLSFDAAQLDKIVAKVREFAQDASTTPALSEQDLALLQSLATTLAQTNRYHATEVREAELKAVVKVLQWPDDKVFPGLDLLRLVVLHPAIKGSQLPAALDSALAVAERCPASAPIVMLSLRCLANLHVHLGSRRLITGTVASRALALATTHAASSNKNIRSAAATVVLNLSVLLSEPDGASSRALVADLVAPGMKAALEGGEDVDDDSLFRVLVALGTLLAKPTTRDAALAQVRASGVDGLLKKWAGGSRAVSQKVQDTLEDLAKLLA